ncbi:MAG: hypothetical protein IKJ06_03750 [Clostridia bacterium]|nr:hypothetical protein [Clostridia bacterium]
MSYTYSFFDNQTVGAFELNNITKLFVSKGIEDTFENGVPYSISKLNDIIYSKGGAGVVPQNNDTLKVTVADGVATINTGTAFFEDGTIITIVEPEELIIEGEGKHYVYLKSSVEENKAYPVISTTAPSGNFVPLAEISEDGVVSDKRCYAKGKVPFMYASDAGIAMKATEVITMPEQEIILSEVGHTYNYYLLRFSGGGVNGVNEPTNWQTFVFINTQNPIQSFYTGYYYTTTRASKIDISEAFNAVNFDFGGDGLPEEVKCKLITDNGIKLQFTCDEYNRYQEIYDYYIYPFKVEVYAF